MQKPAWQIEMLGGLRACCEGREPTVLSRQQTGTLFGYLALHLNRTHSRESLMTLIWPEEAPDGASHNLRQALYALRRQLGTQPVGQADIFVTTRTTIQLDSALFTTDVIRFEQTLQAAAQCRGIAEKIRLLKEAAGIYRGELLPGFYLEEFEPERRRLAELHRDALQMLMRAYEESGDLKLAIETGQSALALDALMEDAHCDLMRLYATQGQPSSIIRQYQALAAILRKELGEEPSQATKLLMESLRQKAQEIAAIRKRPLVAVAYESIPHQISVGGAAERLATPHASARTQAPSMWRGRNLFAPAALSITLCVFVVWRTSLERARISLDLNSGVDHGAELAPANKDMTRVQGQPREHAGELKLAPGDPWKYVYRGDAEGTPKRYRLQNVGAADIKVFLGILSQKEKFAETLRPHESMDVIGPEIMVQDKQNRKGALEYCPIEGAVGSTVQGVLEAGPDYKYLVRGEMHGPTFQYRIKNIGNEIVRICLADGHGNSNEEHILNPRQAQVFVGSQIKAKTQFRGISNLTYEMVSAASDSSRIPNGVINLTGDMSSPDDPWYYVYRGVCKSDPAYTNQYTKQWYRLWNKGPGAVTVFLQGVTGERGNSEHLLSGDTMDVIGDQILVQIDRARGDYAGLLYCSLDPKTAGPK